MSLKIHCALCGDELTEPGALLFGPPDESGSCAKEHWCVDCHGAAGEDMVMLVRRRAEKAERESSKARQALGAALIALSGYVPVITAQELNIDLDWARDALRPILEAATEHELREAERERDALRAALAAVAVEHLSRLGARRPARRSRRRRKRAATDGAA